MRSKITCGGSVIAVRKISNDAGTTVQKLSDGATGTMVQKLSDGGTATTV
ncbi:hypothetical protein HEN55_022665 [Escherichia coli]|nr:hypothetical protein [Escherichia coli]MBB7083614.1 hypothetical protein [Escherichia coli]